MLKIWGDGTVWKALAAQLWGPELTNISKQRNICKFKEPISLGRKECLGVTKTITAQWQ